jgi:hypothetical protein
VQEYGKMEEVSKLTTPMLEVPKYNIIPTDNERLEASKGWCNFDFCLLSVNLRTDQRLEEVAIQEPELMDVHDEQEYNYVSNYDYSACLDSDYVKEEDEKPNTRKLFDETTS